MGNTREKKTWLQEGKKKKGNWYLYIVAKATQLEKRMER